MRIPVISSILRYMRDPSIIESHASDMLKFYNMSLESGLYGKNNMVHSMKKTLRHMYDLSERCGGCDAKTELSDAVLKKLNIVYPNDFYEKSVSEIFLSRAPISKIR